MSLVEVDISTQPSHCVGQNTAYYFCSLSNKLFVSSSVSGLIVYSVWKWWEREMHVYWYFFRFITLLWVTMFFFAWNLWEHLQCRLAMTAHRNAAFFLAAATIAQIIASANGLRELLGDGVCNSTFCKLQLDGGLDVGVSPFENRFPFLRRKKKTITAWILFLKWMLRSAMMQRWHLFDCAG